MGLCPLGCVSCGRQAIPTSEGIRSLSTVFRVEPFHAAGQRLGALALDEGLAAAVDAAAGAGHDLDRLEARAVGADHLQRLARVAEAGGHGDVDEEAGRDLDLRLLDSLQAADGPEPMPPRAQASVRGQNPDLGGVGEDGVAEELRRG